MPTQRTGTGGKGGGGPKKPGDQKWQTSGDDVVLDPRAVLEAAEAEMNAEEDLGLTPEEPFIPDPSGFHPDGPITEIGGREMIRLSKKQIQEMHEAQAPGQRMISDRTAHLSDRPLPDPSQLQDPELRAQAERAARAASTNVEDEAMAGFSPNPDSNAITTWNQESSASDSEPTTSDPSSGKRVKIDDPEEVEEAVRLIEALGARAAEARNEGNLKLAAELTGMAQQILAGVDVKRTQPKKERHPTKHKLLSAFGLEKIKRKELEWCGFKWLFGPRPRTLDFWIADNTGPNNTEFNTAYIASGVLGIDGDPLYKVFNVALSASYTVTVPSNLEGIPSVTKDLKLPVYRKTCESCSIEVDITDDVCPTCGAELDPFDVPIELRIKCADVFKRFIVEKLGWDDGDLEPLVTLYRENLKDPRFDKEEVYPLLKLSKPQETTPG